MNMNTMNTTTPPPTPETGEGSPSLANFTIQKLERELNEARDQLNAMREAIKEAHDVLEEERHAWQKEREDAMADYVAVATQLQAMREAIKEVFTSFADDPASDSAWLLDDRQTAALAKLQPFIKP